MNSKRKLTSVVGTAAIAGGLIASSLVAVPAQAAGRLPVLQPSQAGLTGTWRTHSAKCVMVAPCVAGLWERHAGQPEAVYLFQGHRFRTVPQARRFANLLQSDLGLPLAKQVVSRGVIAKVHQAAEGQVMMRYSIARYQTRVILVLALGYSVRPPNVKRLANDAIVKAVPQAGQIPIATRNVPTGVKSLSRSLATL